MFYVEEQIPEEQWQVRPGEKYGLLTVISPPFWIRYTSKGLRQRAQFRCDCGNEREYLCYRVKSGYTTSCGVKCYLAHSIVKDGAKRCSTCGERKLLSEFYHHKGMKDGYYPQCKDCKESVQIKTRFGIDLDEYNKMLVDQNGVCAICHGQPVRGRKRFDIDHDHETGRVRGLLCSNCNRAIGLLRDDQETIRRMLEYLAV